MSSKIVVLQHELVDRVINALDDEGWHKLSQEVIDAMAAPVVERQPTDFNVDVVLPAPSDPSWSIPVRVSFDAAEGEGRVWLMVDDKDDSSEPWIAIEGQDNARKLASLLTAWAGAEEVAEDVTHRSQLVDFDPWTAIADGKPPYGLNVLVEFVTNVGGKQHTTAKLVNQKVCADPASDTHAEVWYVTVSGGHKLNTVTRWREIPL